MGNSLASFLNPPSTTSNTLKKKMGLSQIVMVGGTAYLCNAFWNIGKYRREYKKVQPILDRCREEIEYYSKRISVIDEFHGKLKEESKNRYTDEVIDLELKKKHLKKSISKIEEELRDFDFECAYKAAFPVISHLFFYIKDKRRRESMYYLEDNLSYHGARARNRN